MKKLIFSKILSGNLKNKSSVVCPQPLSPNDLCPIFSELKMHYRRNLTSVTGKLTGKLTGMLIGNLTGKLTDKLTGKLS